MPQCRYRNTVWHCVSTGVCFSFCRLFPPVELAFPVRADPLAPVRHDPPRPRPYYPFDGHLVAQDARQHFRARFPGEETCTVRVESLVDDPLGVPAVQGLSFQGLGVLRVRRRRHRRAVLYHARPRTPTREEHGLEKGSCRGCGDGRARVRRAADGGGPRVKGRRARWGDEGVERRRDAVVYARPGESEKVSQHSGVEAELWCERWGGRRSGHDGAATGTVVVEVVGLGRR